MEHSTPIPSRWDVSRFLGEDDEDYGDENEEDDDEEAVNGKAPVGNDAGDSASGTPSTRRRKFMEQDPCSNPVMPTPDQWADGVSEHMDFENLPNTEGRYNKIKEIAERRKKPNSRRKL